MQLNCFPLFRRSSAYFSRVNTAVEAAARPTVSVSVWQCLPVTTICHCLHLSDSMEFLFYFLVVATDNGSQDIFFFSFFSYLRIFLLVAGPACELFKSCSLFCHPGRLLARPALVSQTMKRLKLNRPVYALATTATFTADGAGTLTKEMPAIKM